MSDRTGWQKGAERPGRAATALAARLALCGALATAGPGAARAQDCRQALILALDVSLSVDTAEYRLQRHGLARALTHPDVAAAMVDGPGGAIELAVFEWSGQYDQTLLIDWTVIDSRQTLHAVARGLRERSPRTRLGRTALGAAMLFARNMLDSRRHCARRTLDISGDGRNNNGPPPTTVQPGMAAAAISVNGLVIGIDPAGPDSGGVDLGQLSRYFHDKVIVGPAAFVEAIAGFSDYETAIRRKLLREIAPAIAGRVPGGRNRQIARLREGRPGR